MYCLDVGIEPCSIHDVIAGQIPHDNTLQGPYMNLRCCKLVGESSVLGVNFIVKFRDGSCVDFTITVGITQAA